MTFAHLKPTLIFDFDGTIADTHRLVIDISNTMANDFGYDHIDNKNILPLKDKTSYEILRFLHVPLLKVPAIVTRGKKEFMRRIHEISPITGIQQGLTQLKENGASLGILSSNNLDNITAFFNRHNLHCFDFIYTTPKLWSKHTSLRKLIKTHDLDPSQVIYIGDEERDMKAAQKLNLKTAAVNWGYNSIELLKKNRPDIILTNPNDLSSLITR